MYFLLLPAFHPDRISVGCPLYFDLPQSQQLDPDWCNLYVFWKRKGLRNEKNILALS